jgi:hypothetical protein
VIDAVRPPRAEDGGRRRTGMKAALANDRGGRLSRQSTALLGSAETPRERRASLDPPTRHGRSSPLLRIMQRATVVAQRPQEDRDA